MNRNVLVLTGLIAVIFLIGLGLLINDKNDKSSNALPDQPTSVGLVSGGPWVWQNTLYSTIDPITANNPDRFVITFKDDATFSSTTDCNSLAGSYQASGSQLTLTNIASTQMFCEGSQESQYVQMLSDVEAYSIPSVGNLQLKVKTDDGWMNFSNN